MSIVTFVDAEGVDAPDFDEIPDLEQEFEPALIDEEKRARSMGSDVYVFDEIVKVITQSYLDELANADNAFGSVVPAASEVGSVVPAASEVKEELLRRINLRVGVINIGRKGQERLPILKALTPRQIAMILVRLHHVIAIGAGGAAPRRSALIGIYCDSGPRRGTYSVDEIDVREVASRYNWELSRAANDVFDHLREIAPLRTETVDADLVPMENGVFDYQTKTLLPFSPDYVFRAKAGVCFKPDATSPVLHHEDGTEWDVESWMDELADGDEQLSLVIWQVIGATLRPLVAWDKAAFFYSEVGNNGKGTLCELMRNLVGQHAHVSIPLADFGKDFMLEPLTKASAVIVDENDVGLYLDRVANLKAVITNDVVSINRKGLTPISFRFRGFMIQCVNDLPQVRDRSESFYRRQLFIPFTKSYTGVEHKYIKRDYMARREVLEYVAKKVLVDLPPYYEFDVPDASEALLAQYKEFNDPVREFWAEHKDLFKWDLLPKEFLRDLYQSWFAKNNPSGKVIGKTKLCRELEVLMARDGEWFTLENAVSTRGLVDHPEPLILTYNLTAWMQPGYAGRDPRQICMPDFPERARGYLRVSRSSAPSPSTTDA
ncbi:phage/plasmid primase, P4 family [Leifsonia sp. H3M29-4]|uniref:DNA primase family protein n=1 Tax=Salinibacterium metalliresistens TaxID=3031321 RepID=UPI0023DBCED7|nr:phage/plasmid primase, P4 family [Salinibacterium metalliresistens]MDF1477755.1 phage/plasmid primase, P4 family [Salinibacterium metalliresistens]